MISVRRIWFVQFLSLFIGGLPFLIMPEKVIEFTTNPDLNAATLSQIEQVRMVGGASIGISLAALLACTRQVIGWQRGMAFIFFMFFGPWSTTLLWNQCFGVTADAEFMTTKCIPIYKSIVPYGTIWPGYLFALINLVIFFLPGRTEPVPETRIDRAPAKLRWLWSIQGVYYLGEVVLCTVAAPWVLKWITVNGDNVNFPLFSLEQVHIVAAWTLPFALLSLYASLENRIRDWRQYRWVFLFALLSRVAVVAANIGPEEENFRLAAGVTLMTPALIMAIVGFYWTLGHDPMEFRKARALRPFRDADSDAPAPPENETGVVWLWTIQAAGFLFSGLLCIVMPRFVLGVVIAGDQIPDYAADAMRIAGALMIGIASFNVFALMMSHTVYRRRFAIVFTLGLAVAAILLWVEPYMLYNPGAASVTALLALFALANLRWAIRKPPGSSSQDDSGVAGSKPAVSFLGWSVQLLILGAAGWALVFSTESSLTFLSGVAPSPHGDLTMTDRLIHHQWHLVGILSAMLAGLTLVGMGSQREPVWRGFAFFGSVTFIVATLVILMVTFNERYQVASVLVFGAAVILFYMNRWIRKHPATWNTPDTSQHLSAWTLLDLVAGPLMALSVLTTKRRSSHLMGVGARGKFTVSENVALDADGKDPTFPNNDFFKSGKTFDVQARFASLTELDDAALDVRGCAIKFSCQRYESPLDLLMNTGTFCPAFNLVTFAAFVASKFFPRSVSEAVVKSNLVAREGGIAGVRRAPDSFSDLRFYSQIVRHWIDTKGIRHLVRYRCLPAEGISESGLPTPDDASHIWLRKRLPNESRPTNYLREEMRTRIESEGVTMRLQMQYHTPQPGDTDDWYNASVEWDEYTECPWIDLGTLELDHPMSHADTELLQFDPSNHPMTLGIPRASHPLDYKSMGDSEARVVRALQHFRIWMGKTFGPPDYGAVESASEQQR